jgi:diguanylate cyclase (GGDEF)-like protein
VGLERSRSAGTALLVVVLDLDHFKEYNDTAGHTRGDDLLRDTAEAWRQGIGAAGMLARWGGEEFVAFLHCRDAESGLARLDQLRGVVPDGQTVSIGVAVWDGSEDEESLLGRADAALYRAKRWGRDRMVVDGSGREARPGEVMLVTARSSA